MRHTHRPWKAPLALFLLSPAVGELLSSSSPPAEYFNPFGFVMLSLLYGGGALLCRELTVRWGKGWLTLLALGAAYGIVEEGLMVKSFFNPNWQDIGPAGPYARWAGVNWMWSISLTAYHAVFSITIPVLLTYLLFPADRRRPWLNRKWTWIVSALFIIDVLFGFLFFGDNATDKSPYRPPVIPYLLASVAIVAIAYTARRLPLYVVPSKIPAPARTGAFPLFLTGLFGTLGLFVVGGLMPSWQIPSFSGVLVLICYLAFLAAFVLRRVERRPDWSERHQWALATGALSLFVIVAPLREFVLPHADNPAGMTVVALAAVAFLAWLRYSRCGVFPPTVSTMSTCQPPVT